MKSMVTYAACAAALLAVAGLALTAALPPAATPAIWLAAAIAWVVQLVAFAALLRARRPGANFMVAWGGGVALRFVAVVATAFWITSATRLPAGPALLSLVGFVFVLALLEPVFLRRAG